MTTILIMTSVWVYFFLFYPETTKKAISRRHFKEEKRCWRGESGLTLLIQRTAEEYFHIALPFSVINLILNAIPATVSFRFIGKKFTAYSCLMIGLSSILTDVLPTLEITSDPLLISIFGGIISGCAICLCLFADATSGGTDFIAIFFSERKGIDTWNYIFMGNVAMLVIAGLLFGWEKSLYSIIFQFTSTHLGINKLTAI